MDAFQYKNGVAQCEGVSLEKIAAEVGTPAYVYSRTQLEQRCQELKQAFASYPTTPCFAVKSNSNLSVLQTIFKQGFGADLVSLGELERALLAGCAPGRIVFSGVGKRDDEIRRALEVGILSFNVESSGELAQIARLASEMGRKAPVSLRINPNIDAKTNAKISTGLYTTKFGLVEEEAFALLAEIAGHPSLELVGLACHIGSQIVELGPLRDTARRMAELAMRAKAAGHPLKHVDMGGGVGIRYRDETPPSLAEYAKVVIEAVAPTGLDLVIEPGRVVVGAAGVLVTRVVGVKRTPARHFVVLDAAMNDLMRPTLYDSYHEISPVQEPVAGMGDRAKVVCDFVGPICESSDVLGRERETALPEAGDLFMIRGCGAYASTMATQYNTRPRSAEVLVSGGGYRVVRPREDLASLWQTELAALSRS